MPSQKSLTSVDLQQSGRILATPFRVEMESDGGTTTLYCEEVLRCLPGKRLVVLADLAGELVVAKIFLGFNNHQYFSREKAGIKALGRANLRTPEILAEGRITGGANVLVFEYLAEAVSLDKRWLQASSDHQRSSMLSRSLRCIGQMHEAGIRQQDIHPGNFLDVNGEIFIIDGAGVIADRQAGGLDEMGGIDNLAAYLAEFAPKYEPIIRSVFKEYEAARQLSPEASRVDRLILSVGHKRAYRKRKYLTKIFRDCSEFHCESTFGRFLVCSRAEHSPGLSSVLRDPDRAMISGRALKQGNTATVTKIEVEGRNYVIKRYNIKNLFHGLRKSLFNSRARRSWYNAHLLKLYEIPGARPVALLEKRWGPFRLTSYYITEAVVGPDAREFFSSASYSNRHITQLAEIVRQLQHCCIRHGDLKATNFIMAEPTPVLIDLDALKEYPRVEDFNRIKNRDMDRFMMNWQGDPPLYQLFLDAFQEI